MTIRVAVIGASFAKEAYLPALATIPDVELVAISSARLESAQAVAERFNIPHAYDDWKAMLGKHPVDLVGVATPTIYHAPMVLAALEAGAHVICEKPMAMNSNESLLMLEKATALGRVHMIGHELRFNPNRRKIHPPLCPYQPKPLWSPPWMATKGVLAGKSFAPPRTLSSLATPSLVP